jgi:CHAT domain-containing protein
MSAVPTCKAQEVTRADARPLKPHETIERRIAGGRTHSYKIQLRAGEYFHVDVVQRGVDVRLALVSPDGKVIVERDRPNENRGAESLSFIAARGGAYSLEVGVPEEGSEPGMYEIKRDKSRTPTTQDKKRVEAETVLQEGLQLSETETEESVKLACKKYEMAAALWRELGDKYAEALSLTSLGYSWESLVENNKAAAAHARALTIYKDLKDKPYEAASLTSLSVLNASFQKSDIAVEQYRQAIAIYRELNDADGENTLNERFGEAAEVYFKAGFGLLQQEEVKAYGHSLKFLSAAREMYRALEDKKNEALALVYLGRANIGLGDKPTALDCYHQALALHQAIEDKQGEAVDLSNIGKVYADAGDKKTALKYYGQALSVARAARERQVEARTLINIGRVHSDWGDKQKALDHYLQALPLSEAAMDTLAKAAILNNIGGIYVSLGDSWKALEYYKQALPLLEVPGAKRDKARVLNNIGRLLNLVGDRQKALESYHQALPLNRESADKVGEATALTGIGSVYDDLRDEKKAIGYYEQSYHLAKAAGDMRGEATALNNIGSAYDDMGDKQKALGYYVHSLPLHKASADNDGEANTLSNIMYASATPRQAIFYGKQSVSTYQRIRSVNKDVDKELHKTFLKSVEHTYRYLAKLLIVQGRLAEAHQVLNSFKDQQYFDFNPETTRSPAPLDPTRREAELASLYQAASGKLGALVSLAEELKLPLGKRTPDAEESAKIQQLDGEIKTAVAEFLAALKRAEDELGGQPDAVKDKSPDVKDTEQMQTALRGLHEKTKQKAVAIYTVVGEGTFWALIITDRDIVPVVSTIEGRELNKKAKEFLARLSETDDLTKRPKYSPEEVQQKGKELYDLVFAPIAAKLKDLNIKPDVLMWALDGGLRYVPVAALYDGKQYLAERYRSVVFTRADTKRMLSPVSETWSGWGFYNAKEYSVPVYGEMKRYPPLRNARSEVETIFGVPPVAGLVKGKFLPDTQFSRGAFLERLREHQPLVHIASHFILAPGDASSSFLLLGDGDQLTLADLKNEPDDLFGGVELLTLSACETGAQKERESDGREIDSFAELAQRKGAQAILASLWSVADQSTSRLMMMFYQVRQSNKLTKAEALQKAQLSLLKDRDYSHPYYWSPFILIGNWG